MTVGFGYTALVIDAFAGRIVSWECSLSQHTAFVESAIRQATALPSTAGHLLTGDTIHHSVGVATRTEVNGYMGTESLLRTRWAGLAAHRALRVSWSEWWLVGQFGGWWSGWWRG